MNMMVMQLAAKYPKLMSLSDMASLRANQITRSHLDRVANAFDVTIPVSDELVEAFIHLLKGRDINTVADLIVSPEAIGELVTFLHGGYRALVSTNGEAAMFSDDAALLFIR